jgi:hypothetical protein
MLASVPSVRLGGSETKGVIKHKFCSYLCTSECWVTKDPVDEQRKSIRWLYDLADSVESNGKGSADYYCEGAFIDHCHEVGDRDREKYQQELGKDREKLNLHLQRRAKVVARCLKRKSDGRRQGGIRKVSVHQKEFEETALVKPADKFWPMNRYTAKFGSPQAPRNKKLGHVVIKMGGYKGVLVPGDDGEGPWDVITKTGSRAEKDEELSVGSDGGDEEAANSAFVGTRSLMRLELAEAAAGALQSVLNTVALTEDEVKKEEENNKRRKLGKRRNAKKVESKPVRRGLFDFNVDSDDTDEDGGASKKKTPNKMAKGTGLRNLPADDAKSAGAQRNKGPKAKSTSKDTSAADGAVDNESKGPGAPKKDVFEMTDSLWADFAVADENSNFYSQVRASPS